MLGVVNAVRHAASSSVRAFSTAAKAPKHVAVTGAAGAIGYAALFRIASGQLLGPDQPVVLHLLELPQAMDALEGVVMELNDCAFPLLQGIKTADNAEAAFDGIDYALLVGSRPRGPGMERSDLLKANAAIFSAQGAALNKFANRDVRVLVVGNPANTNALITAANAPDLPRDNIHAMTRLDHARGLGMLATQTGIHSTDIHNFAIWGNHSATQYPDISHTTIGGKPAADVLDEEWYRSQFIPDVQQRGAAIIKARGASSAASAACAAIDHVRDWALGSNGEWVSMAVPTDGQLYGLTEGLWYSFPTVCNGNHDYTIIEGLDINEFSAEKMKATELELIAERDAVKDEL